jgi:hypothetical protein
MFGMRIINLVRSVSNLTRLSMLFCGATKKLPFGSADAKKLPRKSKSHAVCRDPSCFVHHSNKPSCTAGEGCGDESQNGSGSRLFAQYRKAGFCVEVGTRSPHERSDTRERRNPDVASGLRSLPLPNYPPPVEKKIEPRLTGPVSCGVFIKLNCFAQNPSAVMRGGFLH